LLSPVGDFLTTNLSMFLTSRVLSRSHFQPKTTRQIGDKPATCIAGFPISRLKQPNLDIKKNACRRFSSPT
ncbi:hypothetical protein P7J12_11440, partial [Streptococcus suis]|uniref:hypothetical protein n=1 Tax=Streptococcus suis TaxID=1307 RepID=UPI0038B97BD8